jgi:predicted ABC-class ATPase
MKKLELKLIKMHKAPYGRYRSLQGIYDQVDTIYDFQHAQGDPHAGYSRVVVTFKLADYDYPLEMWSDETCSIALADFLLREISPMIQEYSQNRGTGNSGQYRLLKPGQEILKRTALSIHNGTVEIRFALGLPADQRDVDVEVAKQMLCVEIPGMVNQLRYRNIRKKELAWHIKIAERQEMMRRKIKDLGWVSFVSEKSLLPRKSGNSDLPLESALLFNIPEESIEVLDMPWGQVRGLAFKIGLTLIAGGAFHGKSTLLQAIAQGVYNHIPGDGREGVITDANALTVVVEDGRPVLGTDLSPFFANLPGADPCKFETQNASGSTSQASSFLEALSVGSRTLLMDEDRSAVNFLIRDEMMRELVSLAEEPLTPLMDKIGGWKEELSLILVSGSSGEYLPWADRVLVMNHYQPEDRTAKAKELSAKHLPHLNTDSKPQPLPCNQLAKSWPEIFGPTEHKIKLKMQGPIVMTGRYEVNTQALVHIQTEGQKLGIGLGVEWCAHLFPQCTGQSLSFILNKVEKAWSEGQFELKYLPLAGDVEIPRLIDVACSVLKLRRS